MKCKLLLILSQLQAGYGLFHILSICDVFNLQTLGYTMNLHDLNSQGMQQLAHISKGTLSTMGDVPDFSMKYTLPWNM